MVNIFISNIPWSNDPGGGDWQPPKEPQGTLADLSTLR